LDEEYISELHKPIYAFYGLTAAGVSWGIIRMVLEEFNRSALALSVVWVCFNLVLLSGALGVLLEKPQRRSRPRASTNETVTLVGEFGESEALLVDINVTNALIRTFDGERLEHFGMLIGNITVPSRPVSVLGPRQKVG